MSEHHQCACNDSNHSGDVSRRRFLAAAGAAAALQLNTFDFASSLFAEEPKGEEPLVSVAFALRPSGAGMTWPSGDTPMLKQIRAHYEEVLMDAAKELGVRLDILTEPLSEDGSNYLERAEKISPDGQIMMALNLGWEQRVSKVLDKCDATPTVVYTNLGTHNTRWMQRVAELPGVYLGSTPDIAWLKYALRMHKTLWREKRMRILQLPNEGYQGEVEKTADSDEMQAVIDFYTKNAEKIVEPTDENILKSIKHYLTIRRLIRVGGYHGVALASSSDLCLRGGWGCVALSRLMDEGFVAACEGDMAGARCQFLTLSLFDLPGFMGNPAPETVNNLFIHSHCTSATKLRGLHDDYRAPFVLRDLHNTGSGVAMMVEWPKGERATLMDIPHKGVSSFVIGAGVVAANTKDMPQPPCGGCRTSVAFALDNVDDVLTAAFGHHKWCVLADIVRPFLAYAKLASLDISDLKGNKLAMSSRFGNRDWDNGVVVV